jgi:hypothetical protein
MALSWKNIPVARANCGADVFGLACFLRDDDLICHNGPLGRIERVLLFSSHTSESPLDVPHRAGFVSIPSRLLETRGSRPTEIHSGDGVPARAAICTKRKPKSTISEEPTISMPSGFLQMRGGGVDEVARNAFAKEYGVGLEHARAKPTRRNLERGEVMGVEVRVPVRRGDGI